MYLAEGEKDMTFVLSEGNKRSTTNKQNKKNKNLS